MKVYLLSAVLLLLTGIIIAQAPHTNNIQRDSFSLKYPSDWKIDTEDEDYDPDNLFSIDSPDDNMIMFMIFNVPVDKEELLKAQIEAFSSEVIKRPEITEFSKWGNYSGTGKTLKGKLLGVLRGLSESLFILTPIKQCL